MKRLSEVMAKYSNHNNYHGTEKDTTHSYGPVYEKVLKELEGRKNLAILEIGVLGGSFLQFLHEIFPEAEIYGVDITLKNYQYKKDIPKIHLFEMDGTRVETADYLNQCFDLIIEDGSHLVAHQKQTLDTFAPYLKKNGVYITESIVQGNSGFKKDLETIGYKHNLTMEWVDMTSNKQRVDDILAIFRKRL
jgi:2-polyprenyl-3-methyl-5-hydroxy-6-metoxy-1,4-benzoquinol methylase